MNDKKLICLCSMPMDEVCKVLAAGVLDLVIGLIVGNIPAITLP